MIKNCWLFALLMLAWPVMAVAQTDPCNPPLTASVVVNSPICDGDALTILFNLPDDDDNAGFDVTYRIGSVTYNLTAVQNGHTVNHLLSASTTVTLVQVVNLDDDDDACFTNFNLVVPVVVSNPQITIISQVEPGCGQNNGEINAQVSGGSQPYRFSLNGGPVQNTGFFTGLPAGNYTISVEDATGCQRSISTTLTSSAAPEIILGSQSNPACGQTNGSISVTATGGTSPFQFKLNNGPYQASGLFSGLPAGNYVVSVLDAAGCTAIFQTSLQNPQAPTLNINAQLNPDCGQSNGSISVSAAGGSAPWQFQLNNGPFQASGLFSGLSAGSYVVSVQDALGCAASSTVVLTNPGDDLPEAQIEGNQLQGCSNTAFVLTGNLSNGITGQWSAAALTPATPENPVWSLENLSPGTYSITWTLSAPGCPNYDAQTVELQITGAPTANNDGVIQVLQGISETVVVLANDTYTAGLTGNILQLPSQGIATLDGQLELTYQPNVDAVGQDTVAYEICLSECPDLCDTALVFFNITDSDDPCVITGDTSNLFTNGLTPNGDLRNDVLVFRIVSVEDCAVNYEKSDIIIYNRWGDIVFEAEPYDNNWEGRGRDGRELPPGVYYFVLRIKLDKPYTQFGSVILLR